MKLNPGDLLEIRIKSGFSYLQFVGVHPEYGDVIWVRPAVFDSELSDFSCLFSQFGYVAFYAARAAVRHGLVRFVSAYPLPQCVVVPRNVRRPGARSSSGRIFTWILEFDGKDILKKQLDEKERLLPIAAIWDHQLLIQRIGEGWCPSSEV
jgi:hypothetical protein